MNLNEAKQLLENHGYIVKEGAFGDWAKRTFQGETKLGQAMDKMDDNLAKYFVSLISGCMTKGAGKLKNHTEFVETLIAKCEDLADDVRYVAGQKPKGETVFELEQLIGSRFYKIMENLSSFDNIIDFKDKVFGARFDHSEYVRMAKKYSEKFGK